MQTTPFYQCLYLPNSRRVCIFTQATTPAIMYYFSRRELEQAIRETFAQDYRIPIYRDALSQFPQEMNQ